ncbi:MAG: sulfatase-like hydrolase/transferase [Planctomycetota bacterium]
MLLVFGGCVSQPQDSAPLGREQPNVILVFIDDMGWADFSCFGNHDASTPAIDRLAAEGIAFEQFYVNSPICSPSRVAISTGQYPQRWGITSFLAHRGQNSSRGMVDWLDPEAPMLARSLRQAGYATGHFGKWHMGGQRDVDDAPAITRYGFDESLTNFEGMGPKLLPATMRPGWEKPGKIWQDAERLGGPVTWVQRSEITRGFVDAAINFMKRAESAGKPFYVNVWPDDVHTPFYPPVDEWPEGGKRELYLAVLEAMDRQLEPLFDYIRSDEHLRNNTLILVCSDNGHEPGAGSAGPLRGSKTTLFEGGIRSSLVVWGPGVLAPEAVGMRNTTSVFAAFDLVPTLMDITGTPRGEIAHDGESVPDVLLGRSAASRAGPLFFSRPPDRKNFGPYQDLPDLALRRGKWKLVCDYDGSRASLYDLDNDPGETTDVSSQQPTIVVEMTRQAMDQHRAFETDPANPR